MVEKLVDVLCLADAYIEAFEVFSLSLESALSKLQTASLGTVVEKTNVGVDLEGLELETTRVLLEELHL